MKEDLQTIMSCFSGEDGGVSFAKLHCLLDSMEEKASQGDEAAKQVLLVVRRFARLIQVAQQ
jgi:hypothetical protein